MVFQMYRLGKLHWEFKEGLGVKEFIQALTVYVTAAFTHSWSARSDKPLCSVFALDTGDFLLMKDVIWHPRITTREKLECGETFFSFIRKVPTVVIAEFDDKHYFEKLCNKKLLRRVGTVYGIGNNNKMTEFQTRE